MQTKFKKVLCILTLTILTCGTLSYTLPVFAIVGTTLTLNPIKSIVWGNNIAVTGKLVSQSGIGIGGKTITFSGTGASGLLSVITNSDGTFSATGGSPSTVGTNWQVTAKFGGDVSFGTSSAITSYSTLKRSVSIALSISPKSLSPAATYGISGTLKDSISGLPLSGMPVQFESSYPIVLPGTVTNSNGNYLVGGQVAPHVVGLYNVTATSLGNALYSQRSTTNILQVTSTSTTSLKISILASPQSGTAPLSIKFTATPNGGSGTYSYLWNFGDNMGSTMPNPTHVYSTNGTYTAKVTITDSLTSTGSSTIKISVAPPLQGSLPIHLLFSLALTKPQYNTLLPIFISNLKSGDYLMVRDDPSLANNIISTANSIKPSFAPGVHVLAVAQFVSVYNITKIVPTLPKGLDAILYDYEGGAGFSPEFTTSESTSIGYFDQARAAIAQYNLKTGSNAKLLVVPSFPGVQSANWDWGLAAMHIDMLDVQMQSELTGPTLYSDVANILNQKNNESPSTLTFIHLSINPSAGTVQDNVNAVNKLSKIPGIEAFQIWYKLSQGPDLITLFGLLKR